MKSQVFTGVSFAPVYAYELEEYRNDSRTSLSGYRLRKLCGTKLFKVAVLLILPLYMLSLFGQKKEIGLVVAVGMSAALFGSTTIV